MNNYPISDFIVSDPDTHLNQNLPNAPLSNQPVSALSLQPWHPLEKLLELLDKFEKKILYDHPSTRAYCSILMMSTAVKWVDYDPDETYDLTTAFPKLQLPLRMNNQDHIKITVCSLCKTVKNCHFPPVLAAIPEEINMVPMVLHQTIKE
ncbi:8119_t:CDS:2 [Entrophospora sp. SA101]|nr:8119_t:CDS:2 [Entrophospora sp. SA101]